MTTISVSNYRLTSICILSHILFLSFISFSGGEIVTDKFNEFDWELTKAVGEEVQNNVILSPISVKLLLGMLYEGAKGNTSRQLEQALNLVRTRRAHTTDEFTNILHSLQEESNEYDLDIGNKLFVDKKTKLNKKYDEKLVKIYNVTTEKVDFSKPSIAVQDINKWAESITKGHIKDLISEADAKDNIALLLINAIYFKGQWLQPFELNQTKPDIFHISSTKSVTGIPFMNSMQYQRYYESTELDASILQLPYMGEKLAMYIVLPNEVDGMGRLLNTITPYLLKEELEKMEEAEVIISLPRFHFDFTTSLKPALLKLGLTDMFTGKANLSGITVDDDLFVSNVIQKAGIRVNELGSTAYVASQVDLTSKIGDSTATFVADHPFVFFIRDEKTNTVVFVGKVINPGYISDPLTEKIDTTTSKPVAQTNFQYNIYHPSFNRPVESQNTIPPSNNSQGFFQNTMTPSVNSQQSGPGQVFQQAGGGLPGNWKGPTEDGMGQTGNGQNNQQSGMSQSGNWQGSNEQVATGHPENWQGGESLKRPEQEMNLELLTDTQPLSSGPEDPQYKPINKIDSDAGGYYADNGNYIKQNFNQDRWAFFDSELMKSLCDSEGNVNWVVSPASLKSVLGMIYEGAAGSTEKELSRLLRLPSNKTRGLKMLHSVQRELHAPVQSDIQWVTANRLLISNKLPILPEYRMAMANLYHARVDPAKFDSPSQTAHDINTWINNVTSGFIPTLVSQESIDRDAQMVLLNAVYFKADWQYPFKKKFTQTECFYTQPGVCKRVNMMKQRAFFKYGLYKELLAHVIELPYSNNRFSMVIVLPESEEGLSDVVLDLPKCPLLSYLKDMQIAEVELSLPSFNVQYFKDLTGVIKTMGDGTMFSDRADLSNMIGRNSKARISRIIHKSRIIVNEKGTEAGAGSAAVIVPLMNSQLVQITINHPFLFFIRDQTTGFLFSGQIADPSMFRA